MGSNREIGYVSRRIRKSKEKLWGATGRSDTKYAF